MIDRVGLWALIRHVIVPHRHSQGRRDLRYDGRNQDRSAVILHLGINTEKKGYDAAAYNAAPYPFRKFLPYRAVPTVLCFLKSLFRLRAACRAAYRASRPRLRSAERRRASRLGRPAPFPARQAQRQSDEPARRARRSHCAFSTRSPWPPGFSAAASGCRCPDTAAARAASR